MKTGDTVWFSLNYPDGIRWHCATLLCYGWNIRRWWMRDLSGEGGHRCLPVERLITDEAYTALFLASSS